MALFSTKPSFVSPRVLAGLGRLGEELLQLLEPLLRQDHAALEAERAVQRPLREREAVAVGRDEAEQLGARLEEHAVQVVAGLVVRDGEEGPLDHLEQLLRLHVGERHLLEAWQRREVLGGQADDAELGGAALHLEVVVVRPLERDLLLRQRAHDLVQVARGDREGALLQHLAALLVLGGDREVEVGRRDDELTLLRLEEDVGEDRHRALLFHDALRAPERLRKLRDADLQFHGRSSSFDPRRNSRGRSDVEKESEPAKLLRFVPGKVSGSLWVEFV